MRITCPHCKTKFERLPAPHGTITRYSGHKCRCEKCRKAAAEYQANRRRIEREKLEAPRERSR